MIEGRNILITGGAGFIGSHIVDLLKDKNKITVLDNLSAGRKENIPDIPLIQKNVEDIKKEDVQGFDAIIHASAQVSTFLSVDYPHEDFRSNCLGTFRLFEACRKWNDNALIIYTSSRSVLGNIPEPKIADETFPYNPSTFYNVHKIYGENLCKIYSELYGMKFVILRPSNSILADERIIAINDGELHVESAQEFFDPRIGSFCNNLIFVPAFNPLTGKTNLHQVSDLIRHKNDNQDAFEIVTRYGRHVKVTGDHSVFKWVPRWRSSPLTKGKLEAIPVRNLNVGDYVAIPSKLPMIEKDVKGINLLNVLFKSLPEEDLWFISVVSDKLLPLIEQNKHKIRILYKERKKCTFKNSYFAWRRYKKLRSLPLPIIKKLGIRIPKDAYLRVNKVLFPVKVKLTNDLLWFLGFCVAEASYCFKKGNYFIAFASNDYLVKKAKKIIKRHFKLHIVELHRNGMPIVYVHSKILLLLFKYGLKFPLVISKKRYVPSWILQLPLSRLKHFLNGYREGDGAHTGEWTEKLHSFTTVSKQLADDIILVLLRFGVVGCLREEKAKFRKKYGEKEFPYYKIEIWGLKNFNMLNWDKGVIQTLNVHKFGDLLLAKIKQINSIKTTEFVYDFTVPGVENFIGGNGICCHNCYGPRQPYWKKGWYNFISFWIKLALENKPIPIYGTGEQIRDYVYVVDTARAYVLVLENKKTIGEVFLLPTGIGTSLNELARKITDLTNSKSKIQYLPTRKGDIQRFVGSYEKAKTMLGWVPKVTLDEGLKKEIEWCKVA